MARYSYDRRVGSDPTASRKAETVTKQDWPSLWPYLRDAFDFMAESRLPRGADHITTLTGKRKMLFQDALKRFRLDFSTPSDLEQAERMVPGTQEEIKRAERLSK